MEQSQSSFAQQITPADQLVHPSNYVAIVRCSNKMTLPNIPCPMECRIMGKILIDHALSYALTATSDVLSTFINSRKRSSKFLAFCHAKEKLDPVSSLHQIDNWRYHEEAYKEYVEMNGGVEVPMIQPEPVESTQGTIRTPRAIRTPNLDQKKFIPTAPLPPSDDRERDGIHEATQISLVEAKTAKEFEVKQNIAVVEQKILVQDVEKLVEGADESSGSEFIDSMLVSVDGTCNRIEPKCHKDKPKIVNDDEKDDDEKHDNAYDDDDDDDQFFDMTHKTALSEDKSVLGDLKATSATNELIQENLPKIVTDVVNKERLSSTNVVPTLISQEFVAHAPKIIEELFHIYMQNMVLNVRPTTNDSTATTSDLQQQIYLRMKSDIQSQVADPELWNALK
nr:hypothetical protein [Tanacetum cinerariifolium]